MTARETLRAAAIALEQNDLASTAAALRALADRFDAEFRFAGDSRESDLLRRLDASLTKEQP